MGKITFGERLTELFSAYGFTPEQVAARTGLSETVLMDLLAGRQMLTGDVAFALADVLRLSPLILLELQRESCLEAGSRESGPPLVA